MISLAAPARAGVEHVLYGEVLEYQCAVCVHQFPAQFMGKVFSSVGNALMDVSKYLAAILRTKNNMVLTGVENMTIAFISLCAHNSYYAANRCITKAKPFLTSPLLKQGALRNIW